MAYAHIVVARHDGPSESPLTLRRRAGSKVTATELDWLIDWSRSAATVDLRTVKFHMSPRAEIVTRHTMRNGALHPVEYRVRTTYPFTEDELIPTLD